MTAKGSSEWYAERRECQPSPSTKQAAPRETLVRCLGEACGLTYLSYHLKCPFCGHATPATTTKA